jgi:hypothetical protein
VEGRRRICSPRKRWMKLEQAVNLIHKGRRRKYFYIMTFINTFCDRKKYSQVDHILIYERWHSGIIDV